MKKETFKLVLLQKIFFGLFASKFDHFTLISFKIERESSGFLVSHRKPGHSSVWSSSSCSKGLSRNSSRWNVRWVELSLVGFYFCIYRWYLDGKINRRCARSCRTMNTERFHTVLILLQGDIDYCSHIIMITTYCCRDNHDNNASWWFMV